MKKIIVTGSSSGFGLLAVKTLAQRGHTVYAAMRNIHGKNSEAAWALRDWALIHQADVRVIETDVASDESVSNAVAQVIHEAGQIDVLVNNAGMLMWGLSETLSTRQLEQIFQVNVFGADRMNKAVLPYMHNQGSGLLIQLSSGLSRLHLPYLGAYSATKAAIDTLTETLHYELMNSGIDSVIIQPGAYPTTNLVNKLVPADTPLAARKYGDFGIKIEQGIHHFFTTTSGSDNPGEVAELIANLIDAPTGQRKLWTTVGVGSGQTYIDTINENTFQFSERIQNLLGIK